VYAINHAATALVFKKRYADVRLLWLLFAVQFVEVLWVIFNYLGIEHTSLVGGVTRLTYMPYSHSVAGMLFWSLATWAVFSFGLRRPVLGLALGLAVFSHLVLDLATHMPDIALAPGIESIRLGSGLYSVPILAIVVETAYGVACWWIYRGSRSLLAAVLVFNAIDIPLILMSAGQPDPNGVSAPTNLLAVTVIFAEILLTWFFVWFFAGRDTDASVLSARRH
jgi:hypothetical protein